MAQDSTIRLKQMNQSEISGFVSQVTSGILANSGTVVAPTGKLTGSFYPLNSNPLGYAMSGDFVSQSGLDSAIYQQGIFTDETYYPRSNPSGYMMAGVSSDFVTTTGNENIDGYKAFNYDVRLEANLLGPHDGMGRDSWKLIDGEGLTIGIPYLGTYSTMTNGGFVAGEDDPKATLLSDGRISGKSLNINGYPVESGVKHFTLPISRNSFNADNTGDYVTGLQGVDFSTVPTDGLVISSLYHSPRTAIPPQKVRIYAKNNGQPPSNKPNLFYAIDENSYLSKLRTTSFIGGRVKHYTLDRATWLNLGFRTHQPVSTVIIDVQSTVYPKLIPVNFPQTNEITIGDWCNIKVNFNNAPSGTSLSFTSVAEGNSSIMKNLATTGGTWTQNLRFVSLSRNGWMYWE